MDLYKQFTFEYSNVIQTTTGKKLFETHCNKEHNGECFEFVEALKQQTAFVPEAAEKLIKTFVLPESPKQINLSSHIFAKLLQRYEKRDFSAGMFNEALFATELLLSSDVFPRFLRSTTFLSFVKNATPEKIQSIGGTSLKHQFPITADLFERNTMNDSDFLTIMNLARDCWSWRQIESNSKTNFTVYKGDDTQTDPEIREKYGTLTRFKTSYYFEGVSAMELLNIAFSKQYLPTTFSQFRSLELLKYDQGTQTSPSYFVFRNTLAMMPGATIRENYSIVSIMYEPVQKVLVKVTRSCIMPAQSQGKKSTIPLYTVSGFFYQHIDDSRCKYTEIMFSNSGGLMQYLFNEGMIKLWAKTVQKGICKAISMYNAKEKKQQQKNQTQDAVYFVQGLDENLKWISVAVNNYKNKYYVPYQ